MALEWRQAQETWGLQLEPQLSRYFDLATLRARIEAMQGDASGRSYYRFVLEEPAKTSTPFRTAVLMRLPRSSPPWTSDEAGASRPPASSGASVSDALPFIQVQNLLTERGVRVPKVYAEDLPSSLLWLEDVGDLRFEQQLKKTSQASRLQWYRRAIELLAHMQTVCHSISPGCLPYARFFDEQLFRWELDHFVTWGVDAVYGEKPANQALNTALDRLAQTLTSLPRTFVHRDFQSRNLMVCPDSGELVVLDFQDALMGPAAYDLAALLCDSYVELSASEQEALVSYYLDVSAVKESLRNQFHAEFWIVALQRKLKDAGRFVFIDRVRGNPDFLQWYAPSFVYIDRALRALETHDSPSLSLQPIRDLLEERVIGYPAAVPQPLARSPQPPKSQ